MLAAAWLQFEVHWFSHAKGDEENPWRVPLQDDDPWPQRPMEIPRTVRDLSGPSSSLKSDRFFTVDYTPKVYTQEGLDWINDNTLKTVLLRHFPSRAPALAVLENAYVPWAVSG